MRWLLLIPVLIIAACGTDDLPLVGDSGCDKEAVATNLEEVAERWDDAVDVAQSSSRIALTGPVGDLQEIRRETRQQDWPECAIEAQAELVDWMDDTIKAFIAFLGQEDDSVVQGHLEDADSHRVAFRRALRDLQD